MRHVGAIALLLAAGAGAAQADDAPPFVPGRPGATESPISAPAGRLQIETEIASYTHDREDGVSSVSGSLLATDLRYGLAHGWDAEIIVRPYQTQTVKDAAGKVSQSGFGDLTIRTRATLMGQDGGGALAVIGFVTLPTSRVGLGEGEPQGGAIVTGYMPLSEKLGFTGTLGAATVGDQDGGREGEFSLAGNLSYNVTSAAAIYGEVSAIRDQHSADTAATFDIGATYMLEAATQIDAGVNLGMTNSADDVTVFAGWAHRF